MREFKAVSGVSGAAEENELHGRRVRGEEKYLIGSGIQIFKRVIFETEAFEEGNVKPESTMSTNETIGLIIRGLIIFNYKEY